MKLSRQVIQSSSNLCQVKTNPRPDNIFCVAERSKVPAELAELAGLAGLKNEYGTRRTHGKRRGTCADLALTLQIR